MKDYTSKNPVFSESIKIVESTDLVNAENKNAAPKQLLENTLALKSSVETNEKAIKAVKDSVAAAEKTIEEVKNADRGINISYDADEETLDFGTGTSGSASSYELPVASETRLGGVKIGSTMRISEDGVLDAASSSAEFSTENDLTDDDITGIISGSQADADGGTE